MSLEQYVDRSLSSTAALVAEMLLVEVRVRVAAAHFGNHCLQAPFLPNWLPPPLYFSKGNRGRGAKAGGV